MAKIYIEKKYSLKIIKEEEKKKGKYYLYLLYGYNYI